MQAMWVKMLYTAVFMKINHFIKLNLQKETTQNTKETKNKFWQFWQKLIKFVFQVSNTAKLNLAFFVAVFTHNLRQNLLRHITKILFFALVLTNMLTVTNLKTIPPLPYMGGFFPVLFAVTPEMHMWAVRPKQL